MNKSAAPSSRAKGNLPKYAILEKKVKKISDPPLKAKQLKLLQFLLSAVSFLGVLEGSQDNVRNIRDMCGKYYHGYDNDHVGHAKLFLDAKSRFKVLWENSHGDRLNYIADGFGPISGLTRVSIEKVLKMTTLSGTKALDGRSILKKAKAAMAECRILLAYWMEFTVGGVMPSGMNEEDALRYVLNKSYANNSNDLDDDDDEDEKIVPNSNGSEDGSEEDDQINNSNSNSSNSRDASASQRSNCNRNEDNSGDESDDPAYYEVMRRDAPSTFCPNSWVLFMLYGPYGSAHFDFEISTAFTMDTDAIEESARNGKLSNKSIREAKSVENSSFRFDHFNCLVFTKLHSNLYNYY
jgi:hypothetical protein